MKLSEMSKEELIQMVKYYRKIYHVQGELFAMYVDVIEELPGCIEELMDNSGARELSMQLAELMNNPPWKKKKS